MTPEKRQQVLLAGLLIVLVLVGGRSVLRMMGGGAGGGADLAPGSAGGDLVVDTVERLRLEDLELQPEEFTVGRNPFKFESAKRRPVREPKPVQQAAPPPAQTRPRPKPAARPQTAGPRPPAVDVVYLGRFGSVDRPIAVFSDGKEIFNALEGGILKEKFVVDKIGYESADLKFVGFPDTPAERLAVGG